MIEILTNSKMRQYPLMYVFCHCDYYHKDYLNWTLEYLLSFDVLRATSKLSSLKQQFIILFCGLISFNWALLTRLLFHGWGRLSEGVAGHLRKMLYPHGWCPRQAGSEHLEGSWVAHSLSTCSLRDQFGFPHKMALSRELDCMYGA